MRIARRLFPSLLLIAGCASVNDLMTPSVSVLADPFDDKIIIRQPPVSAASLVAEPSHVLGFEWNQKFPDIVLIAAGIERDSKPIQNIAFNADGNIFENFKLAANRTDLREASLSRFEMRFEDFLAVASAKVVKMRLDGVKTYTVSSFGTSVGGGIAAVNLKFQPFLEKVRIARARLK